MGTFRLYSGDDGQSHFETIDLDQTPDWKSAQAATQISFSEAAQPARTFEAPAGLILNYIRADRTAAFESVAGRLVGALAGSESPERRAQAAGWKMYRAQEPGPNGNVLYVWLIDPAVAGADYAAAGLLRETFPTEVQSLYEAFNGAFGVGQALINMEPVDTF